MKIAIGIPCMGTIQSMTVASLIQQQKTYTDIEFDYYMIESSLVYDARNVILDQVNKSDADYLLFIDSDIIFPNNALKALLDQKKSMIAGVYWNRSEIVRKPVIYDSIKPRHIFKRKAEVTPLKRKIQGCEEVKACGMGFCLIRKDLIKKITKKFVSPFEPYKGMGEDISFCYRVGKIGEKIYALECNLEHIGTKRYKGVEL